MLPLIRTNIERAFRHLALEVPAFDDEYLAYIGQNKSFRGSFSVIGALTFRPVIYDAGMGLASAQSPYFGFYVFQQALRATLQAVNFQVAGDALTSKVLYAPAVASYYTAAFHAVQALLALNGRVHFDSIESPAVLPRRVQVAMLTRNNEWQFETRARDHRSRWIEVQGAFIGRVDELPQGFRHLFDYMYGQQFRPGTDLVAALKNPAAHRLQIHEKLRAFLELIAEVRHRSLYSSFGADPQVVEALWNGDFAPADCLNRQAIAFGQFARSILNVVTADLQRIIRAIHVEGEIRTSLMLSVHFPWIDHPKIHGIRQPKLRRRLRRINKWLNLNLDTVPR